MVVKRQEHSLTAKNCFFKFITSKLMISCVITDNNAVEKKNPWKTFDVFNLPKKDGTETKKR